MLKPLRWLAGLLPAILSCVATADPGPSITSIGISNAQNQIRFQLYPASKEYKVLKARGLGAPFVEDSSGTFWEDSWKGPVDTANAFYQLEVVPLDSSVVLATTVLNRIAYGPTPDELERVVSLGADAYIREQLAPELIQESLDADSLPKWQRVIATGIPSTSVLYLYLNSIGEGYLDELTLVAGSEAGVGPNLIRNGDFETPLTTNDWTISTNHFGSEITTEIAHSGKSSLKMVASAGGSTQGSSIWQTITPALSKTKTYTLSYWFLPSTNKPANVTVRLSGSGITSTSASPLYSLLTLNAATIDTLRSWHVLHAIESKKQLLEVLLQFFDNHFVTQYSKTRQFFDGSYNDPDLAHYSTQLEFRELQRWRQALLNPQCTFYDLLKISAESPAMIIYLDTVTSRGDGKPPRTANENYARELLELFTFGVDNGYDQNDIVEISKGWTGWRVDLVNSTNEFNPLAPRLVDLNPNVNVTNLTGIWAFNYHADRHNTNSKSIFPGKVVPPRFGAPYAGRNYELKLPARAGNEGLQDGYDIIAHVADQPFTQEFISVKLCRLLVHDDFAIGYDFTDPNLSAEGKLVRKCMDAWENGSPKGQIRAVLSTICSSDLFRGNAGSMQKVKTPLEFTVGAIRALRVANADGSFTAESDGNIGNNSGPLDRMGGMRLFDRLEPDGYPEVAAPWVSAGTLSERLRFVQALLVAKGQSGRTDAGNSFADPVTLVRSKLAPADWTNPGAIADYLLGILYPAEGTANLNVYKVSAINFLDSDVTGLNSSPLNALSVDSPEYATRLRGVTAMLMTFQRFQEQ